MALSSKFLAELLSHIPADQRAGVEAAFEASPQAQTFADQAAKRQSEFSREMDQVRAHQQRIEAIAAEQQAWYDINKPLLELGKQAQASAGADPDAGVPAQLPADIVRMADVEKLLTQREQGAAAFIAASSTLAQRHYQQFGEPLDLAQLLADPDAGKLGLDGVYRKVHAEKIQAQQTAAFEKTVQERVEAKLTEERAKFIHRPPYPLAGTETSPLDALAKPADQRDPTQFSVEAAADEYMRLAATAQPQ